MSDEQLVMRSQQGDHPAFIQLVRRYEQPLAALIGRQVSDRAHGEEVLQQTLLDAWSGIGKLREGRRFGAWLLQVARNRCRDFYRSPQRRTEPTEPAVLEKHVTGMGRSVARHHEALSQVIEALESASPVQKEVVKLFYLHDLTIAEIAKRHQRPQGTIKRQLFEARAFVRARLGVGSDQAKPTVEVAAMKAKRRILGIPLALVTPGTLVT